MQSSIGVESSPPPDDDGDDDGDDDDDDDGDKDDKDGDDKDEDDGNDKDDKDGDDKDKDDGGFVFDHPLGRLSQRKALANRYQDQMKLMRREVWKERFAGFEKIEERKRRLKHKEDEERRVDRDTEEKAREIVRQNIANLKRKQDWERVPIAVYNQEHDRAVQQCKKTKEQ